MLELKVFQSDSAKSMADRYAFFANHPDRPRKGTKAAAILSGALRADRGGQNADTRPGRRVDAGAFRHRADRAVDVEAKSVVAQTYTNFSGGGKYSEIIEDFRVINIQELNTRADCGWHHAADC